MAVAITAMPAYRKRAYSDPTSVPNAKRPCPSPLNYLSRNEEQESSLRIDTKAPDELTEEALKRWDEIMAPNQPKNSTEKGTDNVVTKTPTATNTSKSRTGTENAKKTLYNLNHADIPIKNFEEDRLVKEDIPQALLLLGEQLSKDIDVEYIPESCKNEFKKLYETGFSQAKDEWFRPDEQGDGGLWELVKKIRFEARESARVAYDEANWMTNVFIDLLKFCAGEKVRLQTVSSQTIAEQFLPQTKGGPIRKKIDFAMSISNYDPQVDSIYDKCINAEVALSPMSSPPLQYMALHLGIEVKPQCGGSLLMAMDQVMTFTSAHHAWSWLLVEKALHNKTSEDQPKPTITVLPTIGCTVVGHDWHFYLSVRTPVVRTPGYTGNDTKVINVGPILALKASTDSYPGMFKLAKILRRINKWGVEVYWPWLRDEVLTHVLEPNT